MLAFGLLGSDRLLDCRRVAGFRRLLGPELKLEMERPFLPEFYRL